MSDRTAIEVLEHFEAVDPSGETFIIVAYQRFIVSKTQFEEARIPTTKFLLTLQGELVDCIDENTFELVTRRLRLKRV